MFDDVRYVENSSIIVWDGCVAREKEMASCSTACLWFAQARLEILAGFRRVPGKFRSGTLFCAVWAPTLASSRRVLHRGGSWS